jgi:hypothetical protein
MAVFARVAGAPAGVVTLAYGEGSTNGWTCPSNVPRGGNAVPDEVMGRQVAEFFLGDEGESVVLRDADPNSFVEIDDFLVQGGGPHSSKESDDELLILGEFVGSMRVDIENGTLGGGESNRPVSVRLDCFSGLTRPPSSKKGDVHVSERLSESVVGFETVVSGKHFVEVHISIGKNVEPQVIWEIWAVELRNEVVFGSLEVEKMIRFEGEHLHRRGAWVRV